MSFPALRFYSTEFLIRKVTPLGQSSSRHLAGMRLLTWQTVSNRREQHHFTFERRKLRSGKIMVICKAAADGAGQRAAPDRQLLKTLSPVRYAVKIYFALGLRGWRLHNTATQIQLPN